MSKRYEVSPKPGFDPEVGLLLSALDDSTREWRDNLGSPPVEAITWQPYINGYSIGALILHIIDVEMYWFEIFAAGKPENPEDAKLLLSNDVDQYKGKWPVPPKEPIEWYFDLHDRYRARAQEALREVPPDKLFERKNWSCNLPWVVSHVVEHDSYHGGQAVLLHEMWQRVARQ